MKNSKPRALALSTAAIAALMMLATPPASAQGLFGLIFGGDRERSRAQAERGYDAQRGYDARRGYGIRRDYQVQQPEPQRTQPVTLPRVAGPSYYDYRTDSLVRVDFSAIELPVEEVRGPSPREVLVASAGELDAEIVRSSHEDTSPPAEMHGPAYPYETHEEMHARSREGGVFGPVDEEFRSGSVESEGAPASRVEQAERLPVSEPGHDIAALPEPLTGEMLAALADFELRAEERAAKAIVAHYSANPELIWVSDGAPSAAAEEAMEVLARAGEHGLDPEHYAVRTPMGGSDGEIARFEMELSARILRYMRDVHGGRIDPNRISGYHDLAVKEIDHKAQLEALAGAESVAVHLETMHPQNEFYAKLREELAQLRKSEENEIVVRLEGLIRPGQTNAEFPKILEIIASDFDDAFLAEHGEVLERHMGSEHYVQELEAVIRGAQSARGLQVDGVIGPQTVRSLAGESLAGRIEKIKLAMERLRWLPSDLTERFVFLNAPSFRASYFEGGREKLNMRAIYGNTSRQTYFFKDRVSYVEFHPFWGVPRSILVNTYLERLIHDPGYLDRNGFEVTNRRGQRVSSGSIDWGRYGANIPYDVRQLPGRSNALGELKIMFPNQHSIYMHDTPDRHLFDRANRAISNGCIRLDDPRAMAAAVLGWGEEDIRSRLNGPHSREDLQIEVPVYVAYFTAWPEASGKVAYYDDVYDRDRRLTQAIERVERVRAPSG